MGKLRYRKVEGLSKVAELEKDGGRLEPGCHGFQWAVLSTALQFHFGTSLASTSYNAHTHFNIYRNEHECIQTYRNTPHPTDTLMHTHN